MFPFDADCACCRYLDARDECHGKYWCEKKKQYVSANDHLCHEAAEVMGRFEYDKGVLRKNSKEHGYYIVTAISEILSLGEDNQYFESFKYLRDIVLPNIKEYEGFINDYETVGPILAKKLYEDNDAIDYAEYLRKFYLDIFVSLFIEDEVKDAINIYSAMVNSMKKRYGLVDQEQNIKELICK